MRHKKEGSVSQLVSKEGRVKKGKYDWLVESKSELLWPVGVWMGKNALVCFVRTVCGEDVELVVHVVGASEDGGHDVAEEPTDDAADEGPARADVAAGRGDDHHAHHRTHAGT